jgi:Glycosyltransferase family 87
VCDARRRGEPFLLDSLVSRAFRLWVVLCLLLLIGNLSFYLLRGPGVFSILIQSGPESRIPLTLASVAIAWLDLGLLLLLLKNTKFRSRHGVVSVCTFVVVLVYLNACRERLVYGDFYNYTDAAIELATAGRLPYAYSYLPFLATILVPFVPYGVPLMAAMLWAANFVSLGIFVVVLSAILQRYGFSARLAPVLVLGFTVVNVPILRTLFYVQVNLHVVNFILAGLLLYPQFRFWSAVCLGMAIHLKASPAALVLPFLFEKDKKWIIWLGMSILGIAGITVTAHGVQPFWDFVSIIQHIYITNGIHFRENSVESLFRSAALVFRLPMSLVLPTIVVAKTAVLLSVLCLAIGCMRRRTFFSSPGTGSAVLNGVPALMLFMLLASPLLWEHHPVFVALPFLLMIRQLETPWEWTFYGFAYFVEYLVPTFDFFPWSFGRLLSPLILIVLMYKTLDRVGGSHVFRDLQHFVDSLTWNSRDGSANQPVQATDAGV